MTTCVATALRVMERPASVGAAATSSASMRGREHSEEEVPHDVAHDACHHPTRDDLRRVDGHAVLRWVFRVIAVAVDPTHPGLPRNAGGAHAQDEAQPTRRLPRPWRPQLLHFLVCTRREIPILCLLLLLAVSLRPPRLAWSRTTTAWRRVSGMGTRSTCTSSPGTARVSRQRRGPRRVMPMFAEAGVRRTIPGRSSGTDRHVRARASIRNTLRDTVVVKGARYTTWCPRRLDRRAPRQHTRRVLRCGSPGTYFYWGTTTHEPIGSRNGIDSQLHGAFVIDPAGAPPPPDRIFVLGSWTGPESSWEVAPSCGSSMDCRGPTPNAWPTRPVTPCCGDGSTPRTVRTRCTCTVSTAVTSRGTWAAETAFAAGREPEVVTEMPVPGGTYTMRWVLDEPGNWLLHCHLAFHISHYLSFGWVDDARIRSPTSPHRGTIRCTRCADDPRRDGRTGDEPCSSRRFANRGSARNATRRAGRTLEALPRQTR